MDILSSSMTLYYTWMVENFLCSNAPSGGFIVSYRMYGKQMGWPMGQMSACDNGYGQKGDKLRHSDDDVCAIFGVVGTKSCRVIVEADRHQDLSCESEAVAALFLRNADLWCKSIIRTGKVLGICALVQADVIMGSAFYYFSRHDLFCSWWPISAHLAQYHAKTDSVMFLCVRVYVYVCGTCVICPVAQIPQQKESPAFDCFWSTSCCTRLFNMALSFMIWHGNTGCIPIHRLMHASSANR